MDVFTKGVAFLYSNKNLQHLIEPLVISWGYDSENASSSQFLDYLQWQGPMIFQHI